MRSLLLWLKARYRKFTHRRWKPVFLFVFVIALGTMALARPVYAGFDVAEIMLGGVSYIAEMFSRLLAMFIGLIVELLIPVMLYNNFSTSPVVSAGWALVRDTVNMFFVIILIVIAFGTIFGHKKFGNYQIIPRILIFAVVINFSKTLAGIMIDFGQVIMLTFANALREIAAGNIIEMFGLNKVRAFSSTVAAKPATGLDAALASLASIFILAWVLVIMVLMFGILLYRIVGLWILIVVAPLAWFAGGAKDLISSNAYSDWWAQFKCLVAIGPVLTFFLWLALAVAGAGSAADGFDTGGADLGNSVSFLTEIFEFKHFMSLVIGSAMLLAGMQTAQNICSAMQGSFLGKSLGKAVAFGPGALQVAKGVTQKTAAWGGRKVGAGARAVGRGAVARGGAFAENKRGLGLLTKRGRSKMWRQVAQSSGKGVLGKTVGVAAGRRADALLGARHEEIAKAGEKYKNDTTQTKVSQLERFAQSGHSTLGGKREAQALLKETMGNKDMQDQLRSSGSLDKLWKQYGDDMESDFKGDDETLGKIKDFKKRNADLTGSSGEIRTLEDVRNLSDKALANKDVQAQIKNVSTSVKKSDGSFMNAEEAILAGQVDPLKKAILERGAGAYYDTMPDSDLKRVDTLDLVKNGSSQTQERFANMAVKDGDFNRAQEFVTNILDNYQTTDNDEDRFNMNATLDNIKGNIQAKIDTGELKGVMKAQAEQMLQMMQVQRETAQQMAGTFKAGSAVQNFGALPSLAFEATPAAFVAKNFANADSQRLNDAGQQLSERRDDLQAQKTEKQSQLDNTLVGAKDSLRQEIDSLTNALTAARRDAQDKGDDKKINLHSQYNAVDRDFNSKSSTGTGTLEELGELLTQMKVLREQINAVDSEVDNDPAVQSLRADINFKIDQEGSLSPADLESTRTILDEIQALDSHLGKIDQAGVALDDLISKRNEQTNA